MFVKLNLLTVLSVATLAAATGLFSRSAMADDVTLWTLNFDNNSANVALKKVATDFEAANPGSHVEIVQHASFFGRLFRRETGLTPAHYRLRFGS